MNNNLIISKKVKINQKPEKKINIIEPKKEFLSASQLDYFMEQSLLAELEDENDSDTSNSSVITIKPKLKSVVIKKEDNDAGLSAYVSSSPFKSEFRAQVKLQKPTMVDVKKVLSF